MAGQIHQVAKNITVTNYISTDAFSRPCVDAILSCCQESTYIFCREMALIASNNRWNTMDESKPAV